MGGQESMGWMEWLIERIQLNNRDEEYEEDLEEDGLYEERSQSEPVFLERFRRIKQYQNGEPDPMEVTVKRVSSLNDVQEICNFLLMGIVVIINLEPVLNGDQTRIMDFVSGAVYSMNGDLMQVSGYIYIAAPEDILLSDGALQEADKEVMRLHKKAI